MKKDFISAFKKYSKTISLAAAVGALAGFCYMAPIISPALGILAAIKGAPVLPVIAFSLVSGVFAAATAYAAFSTISSLAFKEMTGASKAGAGVAGVAVTSLMLANTLAFGALTLSKLNEGHKLGEKTIEEQFAKAIKDSRYPPLQPEAGIEKNYMMTIIKDMK